MEKEANCIFGSVDWEGRAKGCSGDDDDDGSGLVGFKGVCLSIDAVAVSPRRRNERNINLRKD